MLDQEQESKIFLLSVLGTTLLQWHDGFKWVCVS